MPPVLERFRSCSVFIIHGGLNTTDSVVHTHGVVDVDVTISPYLYWDLGLHLLTKTLIMGNIPYSTDYFYFHMDEGHRCC